MEQKRRTIQAGGGKKRKGKNAAMIIGLIICLALIFWAAYKISYGVFSSDKQEDKAVGTKENISNLSREELETKYIELEKALEEKDEEIEMLREKLADKSNADKDDTEETKADDENTEKAAEPPKVNEKPAETKPNPTPTAPVEPPQSGNSNNNQEVQQNTPPPAAPMPKDDLISPEDLEKAAEAANQ